MSISNINNNVTTDNYKTAKSKATNVSEKEATKEASKSAADTITDTVEISSDSTKKPTLKTDTDAIKKAIEAADRKYSQLRDLVNKLFTTQGNKGVASNWDALVASGKLGDALANIEVDEETKVQAQKDIAEDGYWGVKQTSERTLDFAKALSGGDPAKADLMLEAFKKGFKAAEDAFGGEGKLPQISYDTYDAVIKGFEAWKNGSDVLSDTATDETIAQATNSVIGK